MSDGIFAPGDRVEVNDPGLAKLREIMERHGMAPQPNHHGTVLDQEADGTVMIAFDEDGVEGAGNAAPYPPNEVRRL